MSTAAAVSNTVAQVVRAPAYDPANLHSDGVLRGEVLFEMLRQRGTPLTQGRFLDLGCGYGGYSIHAARQGAAVTSVDVRDDKLEVLARRVVAEQFTSGGSVKILKGDATDLPLPSGSFDQVMSMGVIEWVPLFSRAHDPRTMQVQALKEIARLLTDGGTYILGTKNRWFPTYALREAQVKWPLVNHLPRALAQPVSKLFFGDEYRTYIHSLDGWTEMLHEAGFRSVEAFLPVYFYQFPLDLWPSENPPRSFDATMEAAAWLPEGYRQRADLGHASAKRLFLSAVLKAGLHRQLWPAFMFVARK